MSSAPAVKLMRATRKAKKGGLPNAMFVQAAIEFLPEEFSGVADEIHIHFPWGSLLQAVALGDEKFLSELQRIAAPDCLLEIVIGIDPESDKSEIERLALPELSREYLDNHLIPKFEAHGFELIEHRQMENSEWSKLETSWARRLQSGMNRKVTFLVFRFGNVKGAS